jgi:hypothetical protein
MDGETMAWHWRFWQKGGIAVASARDGARVAAEPATFGEWETRLIEHGVSKQLAARLADRLGLAHRQFGHGSAATLIRGASLAVEMQSRESAKVRRSARDVREVERLLGAFSGELEKLDEVLEVLSAYAQRMRSKPNKSPRRTLH